MPEPIMLPMTSVVALSRPRHLTNCCSAGIATGTFFTSVAKIASLWFFRPQQFVLALAIHGVHGNFANLAFGSLRNRPLAFVAASVGCRPRKGELHLRTVTGGLAIMQPRRLPRGRNPEILPAVAHR